MQGKPVSARASSTRWRIVAVGTGVMMLLMVCFWDLSLPPEPEPLHHPTQSATRLPALVAGAASPTAPRATEPPTATSPPPSAPGRRPTRWSTQLPDSGLVGDGNFYGLFRSVSHHPVSSESIVQEQVLIASESPRHKIAAADLASLRNASTQHGCLAPESAAYAVMSKTAVCGVARNQVKLAVEWLAWHALVGAVHLLLIDDASDDNLREASEPFVGASLAAVETLPLTPGLRRREIEYVAAQRCQAFAVTRGAHRYALLGVDEFFVSPAFDCLGDALAPMVKPSEVADAAVALPMVPVGHGGSYIDTSRTAFEASNFGGGDTSVRRGVRLLYPIATPPAVVVGPSRVPASSIDSAAHSTVMHADAATKGGLSFARMEPAGTPQWPSAYTLQLDSTRVVKFVSRSLAYCLRAALSSSDDDASPPELNLVAVRNAWVKDELRGFTPLSPSGTDRLVGLNKLLLRALGFPQTQRRERFIAGPQSNHAAEHLTLMRVLGHGPNTPPGTLPTVQGLLDGSYVVRPERLLYNVTEALVDLSGQLSRSPPGSDEYNITFCGYVRNRAKITVEWIQWHRLLGVHHFIIFDDDSEDDLATVLAPFIARGVVELRRRPSPPYFFRARAVKGGLLAAYAICDAVVASRIRDASKAWVGFIDSDEFLALDRHDSLPQLLHDVVGKAESVGGVAVPWVEVSHQGEVRDVFPTQLNRTDFAQGEHDTFQRVKCIARAGLAERMDTAHRPFLKAPWRVVLTDGSQLHGEGWGSGIAAGSPVEKTARLVHYHARTLASWIQRALDGFADDDNKVWDFNLEVTVQRWQGAKGKGFATKFAKDSRVVKLHEDLLKSMGVPSPTA